MIDMTGLTWDNFYTQSSTNKITTQQVYFTMTQNTHSLPNPSPTSSKSFPNHPSALTLMIAILILIQACIIKKDLIRFYWAGVKTVVWSGPTRRNQSPSHSSLPSSPTTLPISHPYFCVVFSRVRIDIQLV